MSASVAAGERPAQADRTHPLARGVHLAAVWSGPLFLIAYSIAFWGIAQFMPPPSPRLDPGQVATFFADHQERIRVGLVLGLVATTLLFPFFAAISAQIARVERGRFPLLAMIQYGGAVLLVVFFVMCHMLWIGATYRSELDPSMVRMLNDLSWLIFVMVFPAYVLQMLCITLASFLDTSANPTFPRWLGYFCAWNGTAGMGGGAAVFVKHGPLAWNGVVGFWIPLSMFAIWLVVMTVVLRRAVVRQFDEPGLEGLQL